MEQRQKLKQMPVCSLYKRLEIAAGSLAGVRFAQEDITAALAAEGVQAKDLDAAIDGIMRRNLLRKDGDVYLATSEGLDLYQTMSYWG